MAELLKNIFDKKLVKKIALEINRSHDNFDVAVFVKNTINDEWHEKELKQRIRHISENLKKLLPDNFKKSINILKPVSLKFAGLEHMIFPDYIELCGIGDLDTSIDAMEYFTSNSSSEFAVRQFIIKYEIKMMKIMNIWSKSKNEHVRRLASEGCRPRLPWAIALPKFKENPSKILPILNRLKNDESEYVRKSVANNLNDISKDNPELVIEIAKKWLGKTKETDWVVKHGCRTLLKVGNSDVLKLFGYKICKNIKVNHFSVTKSIKMGDDIFFEFVLNNNNKRLGKLRLEYAIEFVRKNDKTSKKVFKISEGNYLELERKVEKKHSFRQISTRQYYPGIHFLSLIVNGKEVAKKRFIISYI